MLAMQHALMHCVRPASAAAAGGGWRQRLPPAVTGGHSQPHSQYWMALSVTSSSVQHSGQSSVSSIVRLHLDMQPKREGGGNVWSSRTVQPRGVWQWQGWAAEAASGDRADASPIPVACRLPPSPKLCSYCTGR